MRDARRRILVEVPDPYEGEDLVLLEGGLQSLLVEDQGQIASSIQRHGRDGR